MRGLGQRAEIQGVVRRRGCSREVAWGRERDVVGIDPGSLRPGHHRPSLLFGAAQAAAMTAAALAGTATGLPLTFKSTRPVFLSTT